MKVYQCITILIFYKHKLLRCMMFFDIITNTIIILCRNLNLGPHLK